MSSIYDFNQDANVYDEFYDTPFGSKCDIVEKRLMTKIISGLPSGKMLEIGCGTGHWTQYFNLFAHEITAIDVAVKMLSRAELRQIPNVTCINMHADNLQFNEDTFDYVAAITSLEFIENINGAIDEIKRVLKPGGYLIAGVLNINSTLGKNKKDNPVFENARFFSSETLNAVLAEFGAPEIYGCLIFDEKMEILDFDENKEFPPNILLADGGMLIGIVRNTK